MKRFEYVKPNTVKAAAQAAAQPGAVLKGGGIDLLDRMKERTEEPDRVVGLLHTRDAVLEELSFDDVVRINALRTLQQLADDPRVRQHLPALAEAAEAAASPQIRNRATLGGNLCQHTRCGYYRHRSFPCLKRGSATCPVREEGAVQDTAGIFGNSACACAHPSSIAPVVMAAGLDLMIQRGGKDGKLEKVSIDALYRAPSRGATSDTRLGPGDVIVSILLPTKDRVYRSGYAEVRQKAAFDWALASCAVVVETNDQNLVTRVGVVLGSVAPTPHHAEAVEKILKGKPWKRETVLYAATLAADGATPLPGNRYKTQLAEVVVRRALLGALER